VSGLCDQGIDVVEEGLCHQIRVILDQICVVRCHALKRPHGCCGWWIEERVSRSRGLVADSAEELWKP
jgi:hypothetical protein